MRTVTIELDEMLEREIETLSQRKGQDIEAMIVEILLRVLCGQSRRAADLAALQQILSQPLPAPFDKMTEEEVMQLVDEEIQSARRENEASE